MSYFPPNHEEFNYLRHLILMYGNATTPWREEDLQYYAAHLNHDDTPDDWLYDSFLFLNVKAGSGRDYCADVNLGTTMSGEGDFFAMVSPNPADKGDWEELLDFYLGEKGAVRTLDMTIESAFRQIKKPYGPKRNVVLMLPYPHISQEQFGEINGAHHDFSIKRQNLMTATKARLRAEEWFVDEIVRRFNGEKFRHVHLLGVYWMFETVYRSWEVDDHWLLKEVRKHVHRQGLKFLWIPFWSSYNVHLLDDYQRYYFDMAFLQPNYMFYAKGKGVGDAARAAQVRNAGIEMEYYLELNEPIAITGERHARFRDYLNGGITYGYMSNAACAHFQGVGSLQRMRKHTDYREREFYDDIYHFVKGDYRLKPEIGKSRKRKHVLAVDLGGTQLRAALVDDTGDIRERISRPTPDTGVKILREMADMLGTLRANAEAAGQDVSAIGVSTGGRVDHAKGEIVDSTALLPDWNNVPVRRHLEDELGLPVQVDNDGNCAALAERFFGAGRSVTDFITVVVGTGIGGGVVTGGKLLRGAVNAAAEIGHITIDQNGPECSCGNRGCVELYASGSGLANLTRQLLQSGTITLDGVPVKAEEIGKAAEAGHKIARQLIQQAGHSLGIALGSVINTFNPQRVILGGNVLKLGDIYLEPLRKAIDERAMRVQRESVEVVLSELEDAGLIGAAAMVLHPAST